MRDPVNRLPSDTGALTPPPPSPSPYPITHTSIHVPPALSVSMLAGSKLCPRQIDFPRLIDRLTQRSCVYLVEVICEVLPNFLFISVFQNATFPFASDAAVCRRPAWLSLEDQSPCARVLIKRAFLRPMFSLLCQRVGVGFSLHYV